MPKTKAKPKKKAPPKRERQTPLPEGVLTTPMVAQRLACSDEMVAKLARTGQLPCWRVGKNYRFNAADVDRFKASQTAA